MDKTKISFIAENDWANVLTEYSHCLNKHSEDIETKSICLNKHPLNYNIQHDYDLSICSPEQKQEARQFLENSDVIIFGEEGAMPPTNFKVLEIYKQILGIDLLNSNKKLIIWHPGSHYRNNYNFYNNHPLRDKIYKHLYAIDLYRLSNKEKNDFPLLPYQYFEFNYTEFINNFKIKLENKPWTILHIPSNSKKKGTKYFTSTIDKLNLNPLKFTYKVFEGIPNPQALKEKEKSVFYLDQFNEEGSFGIASLESLFRSNFTFSVLHNIIESLHKLTGEYVTPIVPLEFDSNKLYDNLTDYILNINEKELVEYMENIGIILEKWYNPNSVVNNIKKIING